MMSANFRLAAAWLSLLALGMASPAATASSTVAVNGEDLDEPAPMDRFVEFRALGWEDGGANQLVGRTIRFVSEFDPNDDLPTQIERTESFAADVFRITRATVNCIVFVADPDFLGRIGVDLSGLPERLRVELPFAMTTSSGFSTGYLLIIVEPTGELECGLSLSDLLLSSA